MALAERIPPYIPECSDYSYADFDNEWESRGQHFNLTKAGPYLTEEVVPSLIPGLVLGGLALLGFLLFLVWMFVGCCVSCCRCMKCCKPGKKQPADQAAATQQFISGGSATDRDDSKASGFTYPPEQPKRKLCTLRNAAWAFFWAVALAVVGVSIWGMVESINLTDTTVSDFWNLVDSAQGKVEQSIYALQGLQDQAANLTAAAQALAANEQAVAAALEAAPVITADEATTIAGALADVPGLLANAPGGLQSGIDFLKASINQTIANLESDFEPPTMALEDTWRFVVIAVLFGVMILVALATAVAVWFMTWRKTAAFLVALLWFLVALLMLLGMGLLRGVYVVSDDACLFTESYVVAYARYKATGSKYGDLIVFLVQFYLNQDNGTSTSVPKSAIGDAALPDFAQFLPTAAQQSLGNLDRLLAAVNVGAVELAVLVNTPQVQAALASAAQTAVGSALGLAGNAVTELSYAVGNLTEVASRANTTPLYHSIKAYICCDLSSSAYDMWVAWTVVGCLGFVLALLASARIIAYTVKLRKKMHGTRATMPGGAALWTAPPPMATPGESKPYGSDAYEAPPPQQLHGAYTAGP